MRKKLVTSQLQNALETLRFQNFPNKICFGGHPFGQRKPPLKGFFKILNRTPFLFWQVSRFQRKPSLYVNIVDREASHLVDPAKLFWVVLELFLSYENGKDIKFVLNVSKFLGCLVI